MSFRYCNHIKENGIVCRSAAMRGQNYCYFHARIRARRLGMAKAQSEFRPWRLNLPALEDMHSVQSALMQVLDALAAGCLEEKRAGLLLYGLQQAASNIKSVTAWLGPSRFEVNREAEDRAVNCPNLEAEFGLPKRCDLDTLPEVAFPTPSYIPRKLADAEAYRLATLAMTTPDFPSPTQDTDVPAFPYASLGKPPAAEFTNGSATNGFTDSAKSNSDAAPKRKPSSVKLLRKDEKQSVRA